MKEAGIRKQYVVLVRFQLKLTNEELTEELACPCKRILSTKQGGSATWKVKVECHDDADACNATGQISTEA